MSASDTNPQAEQMAHESMLRNLEAQADLIWPAERRLIAGYQLGPRARVLDVGCGTGEAALRMAREWPQVEVLGVDVHAPHLEYARERATEFNGRVRFELGDGFALDSQDAQYDLVLCRHLLQAVPRPERIVAELARVARPGGVVHLLAEDYGMMHFAPTQLDCDQFWQKGPITYARRVGTDLLVGRHAGALLSAAGLEDVRMEYIVIDTMRSDRARFADVWRAWRDGYSGTIAEHTEFTLTEVLAYFEEMIRCIEMPPGYGVWHVPIASGRR